MVHIKATSFALALLIMLLAGCTRFAWHEENSSIRALAPLQLNEKNQGSVLQRAALAQPDLMLLYGSSELYIKTRYQQPYRAGVLFEHEPTGFDVFAVGKANTTSLIFLQDLAALGPEVRGKKIAISLSPSTFFNHHMADPAAYAGNFSLLHASELAFSTDLSFEVKRGAAQRMLQYPGTLKHNPLLRFALARLADDSWLSRLGYYAVLPLGKLQNLVLTLQDHWQSFGFIQARNPSTPSVMRQQRTINWGNLLNQADQKEPQHFNNPFGYDSALWRREQHMQKIKGPNTQNDATFLAALHQHKEWTDLNLLLEGLHELGAQPLILSMPMAGPYYDYLGISPQAQQAYYTQLRAAAQPYGVPVITFADHQEDRDFLLDPRYHLTGKGWLYYDWALDAFYHGTLDTTAGAGCCADPVLPGDHRGAASAVWQGRFLDTKLYLPGLLGRETESRKQKAEGSNE